MRCLDDGGTGLGSLVLDERLEKSEEVAVCVYVCVCVCVCVCV